MVMQDPIWLHALWAVPAMAMLLWLAHRSTTAAVRRFTGRTLAAALASERSSVRRLVKGLLVAGAVMLIAVALARPGWNPQPRKVKRTGRDVAILLDVSRSMLAEDLKPNRLERAKLMIKDVLDIARGDRIGIVAFAGSAVVKCPLTTDYNFARTSLDTINPLSVARGGTMIGDAIRTTMETLFKDSEDRYRDIILITDGDDQESFPAQAAALAGSKGVRIIALGLGSDLAGVPIPSKIPGAGQPAGEPEGPYITYQGEVVKSQQRGSSLKDIATATPGGLYLNVGVGNIQMDRVYRSLMDKSDRRELESEERIKYQEGFQVFLAGAVAMLVTSMLVSERRKGGPIRA